MLFGTVGVAPSTTTIQLPKYKHYEYPYANTDLRSDGLGIIDPNDWWHTGRPYGLPGTTAIHFDQPGFRNPTLAGADASDVLMPDVPNWVKITSAALSAYHGYKRSHESLEWTLIWGLLGYVFPLATPVVGLIQGFGKPEKG